MRHTALPAMAIALALSGAAAAQSLEAAPRAAEVRLPTLATPAGPLGLETTLPLSRAEVVVTVAGGVETTRLDVTFRNDRRRPVEGRLTLPLADGATVALFALDVDGAMEPGSVTGRTHARAVYDLERERIEATRTSRLAWGVASLASRDGAVASLEPQVRELVPDDPDLAGRALGMLDRAAAAARPGHEAAVVAVRRIEEQTTPEADLALEAIERWTPPDPGIVEWTSAGIEASVFPIPALAARRFLIEVDAPADPSAEPACFAGRVVDGATRIALERVTGGGDVLVDAADLAARRERLAVAAEVERRAGALERSADLARLACDHGLVSRVSSILVLDRFDYRSVGVAEPPELALASAVDYIRAHARPPKNLEADDWRIVGALGIRPKVQ